MGYKFGWGPSLIISSIQISILWMCMSQVLVELVQHLLLLWPMPQCFQCQAANHNHCFFK